MPIYDWRHGYHDDPNLPVGEGPPPATVSDEDGKEIRGVFWCNTDTAELERMVLDRNERPAIDPRTGEIKSIYERRDMLIEFPGKTPAP